MSEITKIVVDAMGGDNAPVEPVKAAVQAVQESREIQILLTGQKEVIESELKKYTYPEEQIRIVDAREVIETAELSGNGYSQEKGFLYCSRTESGETKKKQTPLFHREAPGSPGRRTGSGRKDQGSGAAAAGTADPHQKGVSLLIDCGANVDAVLLIWCSLPRWVPFYMENVVGIP